MGIGGCIPGNIKTKVQIQKELDLTFGKKEYILKSKYQGYQYKHNFLHKCGLIISCKYDVLKKGEKKCSCLHTKQMQRTLKSHNIEVKTWRGNEYECVKFNKDRSKPNTYIHNTCGYKWQTTINSFKLSKTCPQCHGKFGSEINRVSQKQVQKRLDNMFGKEYKLIETYQHINQPVKVKHNCGHKYSAKIGLMFRGWGQCPKCFVNTRGSGIKSQIHSGIEFKMQGFEPLALKRLLKKHKAKDIVTGCSGKMMKINFKYEGVRSNYTPDFYIKKANLVVEVKSLGTLGLVKDSSFFGEDVFERNQAKARQVEKLGYRFRMYLFDNSRRIKLPDNWMMLSRNAVADQLGIKV